MTDLDTTRALIAEAEAHVARTVNGLPPGARAHTLRGEGADDRLALVIRLAAALSVFTREDADLDAQPEPPYITAYDPDEVGYSASSDEIASWAFDKGVQYGEWSARSRVRTEEAERTAAQDSLSGVLAQRDEAREDLEVDRQWAASLVALLPNHWDDDVAEEALVSRFMATWAPVDAALDVARQEDDYNDDEEILFRWDSESGTLVRVSASRTVETAEEWEALPTGSVVRTIGGTIATRHDATTAVLFGDERPRPWSGWAALPAAILWQPVPPTPEEQP